jgi:signal transduction histidine kinase
MEAGAYVVRKKKFDIKTLIKKTCDRYNALPNEKQFSINFEDSYPSDAPYFGDPLRLEQVTRIILINAIKHVSSGGNINLSLSKTENKTLISIENEGEHITKSDLPHIFDSYYQGKTEEKGSGLGLAIAHHIVLLHEGEIRVSNTKGGVMFIIVLP